MKKGDGAGLILLTCIIALIIGTSYFFLFALIMEKGKLEIKVPAEIESELDISLINFVKINSDLIVKSVKSNDYTLLEKEVNKWGFDGCWELSINTNKFNKKECTLKEFSEIHMNIPDYKGNNIKIILKGNKNE